MSQEVGQVPRDGEGPRQWTMTETGTEACCSFFAASGPANTPGCISKVRIVVLPTIRSTAQLCGYLGGKMSY